MEAQKAPNQNLQQAANLQNKFDSLSETQIWAYGMGHCLNDLTAACWFNYLLFFLTTVVHTTAAPYALLFGQLCDGIATPLVGFLSDKYSSRFGKRTPWYVFGLVTIVLSFTPIFKPFRSQNVNFEYLYYTIFPGLFNVGWASLQISHMSLVPALSCSRKRRDKLNNFRNSFTFVANLLVLALGLAVFAIMDDRQAQYQLMSMVVIAIGLCTSLFFLHNLKETQLVSACSQKKQKLKLKVSNRNKQNQIAFVFNENILSQRSLKAGESQSTADDNVNIDDVVTDQKKQQASSLGYWLKQRSFYLYGVCYVCVRLNSSILGTFLPFYLIFILKLSNQQEASTVPFQVALVPLVIYFCSSLVSTQLGKFYSSIGRRRTLLFGTLLSILSLGSLYFIDQQTSGWIYLSAAMIGTSQSMVLSTGINLISDVIGNKSESGAVVFGIYSFLDKVSAGVIIFALAKLPPFVSHLQRADEEQAGLVRMTVVVLPMLAAVLGASALLFANVSEYTGHKQGLSQSKMENQEFVHTVTLK